jgi:hypothetical protein
VDRNPQPDQLEPATARDGFAIRQPLQSKQNVTFPTGFPEKYPNGRYTPRGRIKRTKGVVIAAGTYDFSAVLMGAVSSNVRGCRKRNHRSAPRHPLVRVKSAPPRRLQSVAVLHCSLPPYTNHGRAGGRRRRCWTPCSPGRRARRMTVRRQGLTEPASRIGWDPLLPVAWWWVIDRDRSPNWLSPSLSACAE